MLSHLLKKHSNHFYQEDRQQIEAPKGNFTSVARCGLDGTILGPTNHHAYQTNLMQLYKNQFRHMTFERFKESITSVRDPEAIKKWQEASSWKTSFKPFKANETEVLHSEGEVERHFKKNHFSSEIRTGTEFVIPGAASRDLEESQLMSAVRNTWQEENRFPINISRQLREDFFKAGLHVFKGRKGMQYVSLARPKPLAADASNVSKSICTILEFIQTHPTTDRKKVTEALSVQGELSSPSADAAVSNSGLLQDMHWLVRQGHVIEYNNGHLEVVRVPPQKPKPIDAKTADTNTEFA
jgi:hypothetical protein